MQKYKATIGCVGSGR